jgi:hypothetical protein
MRSAQVQLSRSKQKAKRLKQIKTARLFLYLLVQRAAGNEFFLRLLCSLLQIFGLSAKLALGTTEIFNLFISPHTTYC